MNLWQPIQAPRGWLNGMFNCEMDLDEKNEVQRSIDILGEQKF